MAISRAGFSYEDMPFECINKIMTVTVHKSSRDPLDHTSYIIPAGTVMAPILSGDDAGLMKPVRRALVTAVNGSDVTVTDADPFAVGDVVQYIDANGPATGGVVNCGSVTAVNYTTNVITVSNAGSISQGDWLEVAENGTGNDGANLYNYARRGVLAESIDVRTDASDNSTARHTIATVVVDGVVDEDSLNLVDSVADDEIVIYELSVYNLAGDVYVRVADLSDESYSLPDTH